VPEYPFQRPLGAHPGPGGRTAFRVWAPRPERLALRINRTEHELEDVGHGIFEATVEAGHGDDYVFVADGTELPDPCTRWQPDGLRGPSRIVDPGTFRWTDSSFQTPALEDLVVYEMHVGTFSDEGTFEGAIAHLGELAQLGVNAIEVMPIAEFPGRHGWGYDGVYISAAHSAYGGPEGFQKFVDAAHGHGLAVILDVVYNHLGASGVQAMETFGPYFTDKYETFWGKSLNYDDAYCDPVREWVLQSVEGWIRDFHVDGLRLDAVHAIFDSSPEHIIAAVARRAHGADHRSLVIAEWALNDAKVMRPRERGGWGCDAAWADEFHHALKTVLTGEREGYYEDFGRLAQLAKAFHRPYVYDGQYSPHRKRRFGAPAGDLPPEAFVVFTQNHDQVGNRALGDRPAAAFRPLAALCTLLSPYVPMLWQGEEYGEPAPFQFFSDHIDEEIAEATREGRKREFEAFASFAGADVPDPQDPRTFMNSKLTRERDQDTQAMYKALLEARRHLPSGDVDHVSFDEDGRWLHVQRGAFTIVANFSADAEHRTAAGEVVVAAGDAALHGDEVVVGPMSGALVR
jgi:maltooligosyltrehalose trehalohydrolase